MKRICQILLLSLLPVISWQGKLYAQEEIAQQKALTFFMEKAQEDAIYEQNIQLQSTEDELDFWKDQRNYERALKKLSYTAYQVYINTKLEAYESHISQCQSLNKHGKHFFLQANFYAAQGKRVKLNGISTAQNSH